MMNFDDANVSVAQEQWEFELDVAGSDAPIAWLEAHCQRAPDANAERTHYLKGFLAGHAKHHFSVHAQAPAHA